LAFTETDYGEFNLSSFSTDSVTLNTNFSYPYSDTGRIGFGAGIETLKLDPGFFTSLEILDFLAQNGDNYNMFSANVQWSDSTLNRGVLPTNGRSHRVGFELTVPGSDLEYYKLTYAGNYYRPITGDL